MKIPARCNKRSCQARRSLSKRPEHYARWPRCHFANCTGRMYVDEDRLRGADEKRRPTCTLDCLPYPHRVDTPGCRRRENWELERSLRPVSRHCPLKPDTDCPF